MYSHNLDCLNDHIEVLLKIITNKIEKTNSYNINLNLLEINTSTKVTWIIPEKNFIDVNYIVKEEKKVEKINEIINNHFTQSKPDKETKTKKLGFSQIFNTNFHINKSKTKSKKDFSLEENLFHSNKKAKDNRTKSHILKLKPSFLDIVIIVKRIYVSSDLN